MTRLTPRERLISRRQQLVAQETRTRVLVGQLLDRLMAAYYKSVQIEKDINLVDWELDKLIDQKMTDAWKEPTVEDQVR